MLPPHLARKIVAVVTLVLTLPIARSFADDQSLAPSELSADVVMTNVDLESNVATINCDRIWLISSRHLTSSACYADLDAPALSVCRLDPCGRSTASSLDEYLSTVGDRTAVLYVHGNRIDPAVAAERGLLSYRKANSSRLSGPVDWVIFSWPSAAETCPFSGVRDKARRTDAHGLYLAWLLRHHVQRGNNIAMIGYSFGGRMISGSLHALAGGALAGRRLPGEAISGANIAAGMIAPALDATWLQPRGYHGLATQNLHQLTLMYNPRDLTLRNYWRLTGKRKAKALGAVGSAMFGCRADGTQLPVRFVNCSGTLGRHHREVEYYALCSAGSEVACLVNQTATNLWLLTNQSSMDTTQTETTQLLAEQPTVESILMPSSKL